MPLLSVDNEITRLPEWNDLCQEQKDILTEFYFLRRRMHVVYPKPDSTGRTVTLEDFRPDAVTIDAANNSEQSPEGPTWLDALPDRIREAFWDLDDQRDQAYVAGIDGRIDRWLGLGIDWNWRGFKFGLDFDYKDDLLYIAVPNSTLPLEALWNSDWAKKGVRRLAIQTAPLMRMLWQPSSFDTLPFDCSVLPEGYPHFPSVAALLARLFFDMEALEELYLVTMPYMGPPEPREPKDRWGFMALPDYMARKSAGAQVSPIIVSFRRVVTKVQEILDLASSHCKLHAVVDVDARRP
ncbi:hypothetical protein PGQ11_008427 [Apiospora arundinis]|uniref:Uncharacterized protein n=1 Tax=Apiospora arundinis TaxID=335852 RepID=A0ABR2IF52_9PEZI